jgi:hypothetical protein
VAGLVFGRRGINRHAANRIDDAMPVMFHHRPVSNSHKPLRGINLG